MTLNHEMISSGGVSGCPTDYIIPSRNLVSCFVKNKSLPMDIEQQRRISSSQAENIRMFLDLDRVPWYHNIGAAFCCWILLAGYLIVPTTFTSLRRLEMLESASSASHPLVIGLIQNPPLVAIASVFFISGASVLIWLGWTWRRNRMWLTDHIFM